MEMWAIVVLLVVLIVLGSVIAASLMRMIAPANQLERELDDQDQINYLDKISKGT